VVPRDVLGVNLAIRADLLGEAGAAFDPRLGPSGTRKIDYEELELVTRLNAGHRILYVPNAVVRHRIAADRMTWRYMRSLMYQRGFGSARLRVIRGEQLPVLPRRISRVLRTWVPARAARRVNAARDMPLPKHARDEFDAYFEFGNQVGLLLLPYPHLTDWAADRLA
ncbi:MAG: hypothetical protein M3010_03890, partial [Candidatus Dormibacteraeota bacterium]|nr:hypothetical protein [Candidatus Dormibacteraeota bacterium]